MAATTTTTFGSLPHDHFEGSEEPCPICYEHTSGAIVSTPCGHAFHLGCLNTWFDQQDKCRRDCTCPCCRGIIFECCSIPKEEVRVDGEEISRAMLAYWWSPPLGLAEDTAVSEPESGSHEEGEGEARYSME